MQYIMSTHGDSQCVAEDNPEPLDLETTVLATLCHNENYAREKV